MRDNWILDLFILILFWGGLIVVGVVFIWPVLFWLVGLSLLLVIGRVVYRRFWLKYPWKYILGSIKDA